MTVFYCHFLKSVRSWMKPEERWLINWEIETVQFQFQN
jgi:hypothetical protein